MHAQPRVHAAARGQPGTEHAPVMLAPLLARVMASSSNAAIQFVAGGGPLHQCAIAAARLLIQFVDVDGRQPLLYAVEDVGT